MGRMRILVITIPIVIAILGMKLCIHYMFQMEGHLEFSDMALFLTAGVFVSGFMLTGVLADFKESEKIPGELASSLVSILSLLKILYKIDQRKKENHLDETEIHKEVYQISESIHKFIHNQLQYSELNGKIDQFEKKFSQKMINMETSPIYMVRFQNEIAAIRKATTRVQVIAETGFISTGYLLLETIIGIISVILILIKFGSMEREIVLTSFIILLYVYIYFLIKDLDNPFSYSEGKLLNGTEINTDVLNDFVKGLGDG